MINHVKLSILIVYYKERNELFRCLDSIYRAKTKVSYEIVIVDNSNNQVIKKKLNTCTNVKYVKSSGNIGYGRGINLAAKNASGEYIFTLNPDTELFSDTLKILLNFLTKSNKKVVVSPMLVDRKGNPFPLVGTHELTPLRAIFGLSFLNKLFPNNLISKSYWIKTENKKDKYKADNIPGIFMMKRTDFLNIDGFDEKFFLYFEDTDLFKRLKGKGFSLFVHTKARIMHIGHVATSRNSIINEVFKKSRFYYFKKHYGFLSALLVESFLRINKWSMLILSILLISSFLRVYRLPQNLVFHGELGVDYLAVRDILLGKRTALLGPRTSHEWLYLAPVFYWIFAIILPIFDYSPLAGAYFFAAVGVFSVYLCYKVVGKVLGRKAGLISSYLLAISPAWVRLTRDARFNAVAALLFFPYIYFLVKIVDDLRKNQGRNLFWLGIVLGLSYSFFPTIIVLLPSVFIFLFMKGKIVKSRNLWLGLAGLIMPLIPFLIYEARQKFNMIFNLLSWIPYRIAGFVGLYPKNTVTPGIVWANFTSLYTFFADSFLTEKNIIALFLFILTLSSLVFSLRIRKSNFWLALVVTFVVTFVGLFLHGDPPKHYYLAIFPIPIILVAGLMVKISSRKIGIILSSFVLLFLTYYNMKYYFSERWFYLPENYVSEGTLPVPYALQEKIADKIVEKSAGRKFVLKRVGPLDYFEDNFAQNYDYLLWRKGHEPVEGANLTYTVYETVNEMPFGNIYRIGNIAILEKEQTR